MTDFAYQDNAIDANRVIDLNDGNPDKQVCRIEYWVSVATTDATAGLAFEMHCNDRNGYDFYNTSPPPTGTIAGTGGCASGVWIAQHAEAALFTFTMSRTGAPTTLTYDYRIRVSTVPGLDM